MHPADEKLSRFLSLVLRHKPKVAGLEIAPGGWVSWPDLLVGLRGARRQWTVTEEHLRRIVRDDPKGRYELDTCGEPHRIRARYGHSLAVDLDLVAMEPPATLYHGTARRFLGRIWAEGLRPMGRQYVHLAEDIPTAIAVGRRRDPEPALLVIRAAAMGQAGHIFYRGSPGTILTKSVPATYLQMSE